MKNRYLFFVSILVKSLLLLISYLGSTFSQITFVFIAKVIHFFEINPKIRHFFSFSKWNMHHQMTFLCLLIDSTF